MSRFALANLALALSPVCVLAFGGPDGTPWAGAGGGKVAVAGATLGGAYATSSTATDSIEIRDVRAQLVRTITRAELNTAAPWMGLDAGHDGPAAMAWSASGRLLFILVCDENQAPDGLGSDTILRYDALADELGVFARRDVLSDLATSPHLAMLHRAGRLFLATPGDGLVVYRAERNDRVGAQLGAAAVGSGVVRGLALDWERDTLYAATDEGLYFASIAAGIPQFTRAASVGNVRAITHTSHFGTSAQRGLFIISGATDIEFAPDLQAIGVLPWSPTLYAQTPVEVHDLEATACGRLLVGAEQGPRIIRETDDPRLSFEAWLEDEFNEVVRFAKALVAPDAIGAGWVIDADVRQGWTRFHPATPDAAAWAALLLLTHDEIYNDPSDRETIREVLTRYAGLAPDGIAPSTSADGIYRHWIDPDTGSVEPGWDPEFATLSTMKIVLAAHRAREKYVDDPGIVAAADTILAHVRNWDAYLQPTTSALYFKGLQGGGPDPGAAAAPFHEGILFVEQAAALGDARQIFERWLDRWRWPTAEYISGMPVTGDVWNQHQAAFVSLYPYLTQRAFRSSALWREQIRNLLASNAAWTDDSAPDYFTVFSAGSTAQQWGGYNADSLSNHPGDVTTFPSLMAFSGGGESLTAVAAYNAYRRGARQTFAGGASILYRRSNADAAFTPNDAGLPDVALGALGIAELIDPGVVDRVLAVAYACEIDFTGDGELNTNDLFAFLALYAQGAASADLNADGAVNTNDFFVFLDLYQRGC